MMPEYSFFQRLGLFIDSKFLDPDLCGQICSEMLQPDSIELAGVYDNGIKKVDTNIRKVKCVNISSGTYALINTKFQEAKLNIEHHYNLMLDYCEEPQFLFYEPGDFYEIHTDSNRDTLAAECSQRRSVSAIIFLNSESSEPDPQSYRGGSLVLYGLMTDPAWKEYGFNIRGRGGLLITFPSHLMHEVTPVIQGNRFTIVTWFPSKTW